MLERADIAARIPHQGSMCLLDRVLRWDDHAIECESDSHRDARNPLRAHGRLAAVCGIEYAAQAMAVHGALQAARHAPGEKPRGGYLASVRSVHLRCERLDDAAGPLAVRAQRIGGDPNNILYEFSIASKDGELLAGRAAVVLVAPAS